MYAQAHRKQGRCKPSTRTKSKNSIVIFWSNYDDYNIQCRSSRWNSSINIQPPPPTHAANYSKVWGDQDTHNVPLIVNAQEVDSQIPAKSMLTKNMFDKNKSMNNKNRV